LGKSDISAENSMEAADDRIKISNISTQTNSKVFMKINPIVIDISMSNRTDISFLNSIRSIRSPIRGANITAGSIDIAAVNAMVISSAPKATIIEKIAT
jgi:hypothetical protein